jgi:hypothetical protein
MPNPKYAAYNSAVPYFNLVRGALGELVDGEHFFDIVAAGSGCGRCCARSADRR